MSWKKIILYTVVTFLLLSVSCIIGGSSQASNDAKVNEESSGWTHLTSANGDLPEPSGSTQQTASLIFDVNKDGVNDFIIGARKSPGPALVWYQRETNGWSKYVIDDTVLDIEAGGAYHDIDADGDLDVVMGGDVQSNKVWWWENPFPNYEPNTAWIRREIKNSGAVQHHDQIFGDFDGDGAAELVFWNQPAQQLFLADLPADPRNTQPWSYTSIANMRGEGLAKADIDGDGKLDIVGAGHWFKHNGGNDYTANVVDNGQLNSRAAVGQLKAGGRPEIVFVVGDGIGRLKWYEWTGSSWTGHDLLGFDVEHGHSLEVADVNGDGNLDIFVAEMWDPDAKMWIFLGDGSGNFVETQVATGFGNHESKVGDLDGDGDLDILGKPYRWQTPRVDIWLNELNPAGLPLDQWQRHVIDDDRPWRSIFITAADLDGDKWQDIVTGGWWYKNPGDDPSDSWTRSEIGSSLKNMAAVYDFDNDNDADILGTTGQGSDSSDTFVWAQNNGAGQFNILDNVSNGDGDFLQGVSVGRFQNGDLSVALSWHQGNKGVQQLTVPTDPSNQTWPWSQISPVSQDEDLSSGDIDKDGDLDLLLGTKWLRNEGANWTAFDLYIPNGMPDRNELVDINGDGTLDAVVGYEAISKPGTLAWYEQGQDPTGLWMEHIIADPAIIGPMSLDIADMDADGDMDVVVGEHNTANPSSASLYVFENLDGSGLDWTRHLVYTGDEHHDGAQVVDIDNDGDLDIISIGWTHDRVVLYENTGSAGTNPGTYTLGVNIVGSGSALVNPNKLSYNPGETVQLTAQPTQGWIFDSWSGDPTTLVVDSDNPLEHTIQDNTTITATFTQDEYSLTVNTVGGGSVDLDPDQATYVYGDVVTLTATADNEWIFVGWSGDVASSDNLLEHTILGDTNITATFIQDEYTLTVNTVGDGSVDLDPDQSIYVYGDVVTLTAASAPGWTYTGWSGDVASSDNPLEHTILDNTTITATFIQDEYTLTVNMVGSGSVDIDLDQATYHYGDVVTLTATSDPGWTSAGWNGYITSSDNPLGVTIHDNTTITATFTLDEYTLAVNTLGSGSVDIDPDQTSYHYGDIVTLTADPDPSLTFSRWSGDASGSDNPMTITIYGNTNVTAIFTPVKLFLPILLRSDS